MKMSAGDDDPFASVAKLCHTSSSQEILLRNCPFARQSEVFSDDNSPENDETPVESTGIVMVSPPDTPKDDDTPQEEFQTPPEDSLHASSDDQRITTVDRTNHGVVNGDNHESETMAVDDGCADGEKTVDLGKDSDLGFSSEFRSKRLKLCEENLGLGSSKGCVGTAGDLDSGRAGPWNYGSKSSENCHGDEEMLVETKRVISCNGSTEVVESDSEENDGVLGFGEERADNGASSGEICEGQELQRNGEKRIEDFEKFRYVGPSQPRIGRLRRELPASICERAVRKGELAAGNSSPGNPLWASLRGVLKVLAERHPRDPSLENVSLLDAAKSCGMTFPRPSWWRPEGYEEKEVEPTD